MPKKLKSFAVLPNFSPEEGYFEKNNNKGILFLSNFIREKGIMTFLEVIRDNKENIKDFKVSIAGNFGYDVEKKEILEFISVNELNIQLHENVRGKEKTELFKNHSIFIFPSNYKHESMPLSILEAISHGLYTLAFDVGAISDLIKSSDIGKIVSSVEELKKAISDISNKDVDKTKIANYYRKNFSRENYKNLVLKILSDNI